MDQFCAVIVVANYHRGVTPSKHSRRSCSRTNRPTVPVSAILTTADGQTQVRVIDGKESHLVPVTVRALASGLAVVDGIEVGTKVEAIAEQSRE